MLTVVKPLSGMTMPRYTVFVPFTRDWCLDRWIENFDKIKFYRHLTELVFYIDTDNPKVYDKLLAYCEGNGKTFLGAKIYVSGNPEPKDVNVKVRRNRIVDVKERSKALISGYYVFGLEDDTIAPPDAFMKLRGNMFKRVGYVEGVEAGRWGVPMVGAWQCDDINNPTVQKTMLPPLMDKNVIEKITGGGFYCYLTLADLYRNITYRWHDECFGPDVCFVMDVVKAGFEAYVDWGVECTHMVGEGTDLTPDKVATVEWRKIKDVWQLQPYITP